MPRWPETVSHAGATYTKTGIVTTRYYETGSDTYVSLVAEYRNGSETVWAWDDGYVVTEDD